MCSREVNRPGSVRWDFASVANQASQEQCMSLLYSCIHSDADENTRSTDCATGPDSVTVDVQERRLRRVLEMIESEPSRSVRELALEVRLSPAHLQRLFKQRTGVLIGGLVAEARL